MLLKCPSCGGHIPLLIRYKTTRSVIYVRSAIRFVHLDVHWDAVPTTSSLPPNPSLQHTPRVLIVDDSETFFGARWRFADEKRF